MQESEKSTKLVIFPLGILWSLLSEPCYTKCVKNSQMLIMFILDVYEDLPEVIPRPMQPGIII